MDAKQKSLKRKDLAPAVLRRPGVSGAPVQRCRAGAISAAELQGTEGCRGCSRAILRRASPLLDHAFRSLLGVFGPCFFLVLFNFFLAGGCEKQSILRPRIGKLGYGTVCTGFPRGMENRIGQHSKHAFYRSQFLAPLPWSQGTSTETVSGEMAKVSPVGCPGRSRGQISRNKTPQLLSSQTWNQKGMIRGSFVTPSLAH